MALRLFKYSPNSGTGLLVEKKATDPPFKPLELSFTKAIYTLNSGRSPQGYGIIPDFHFSRTGEPLDNEAHYISNGDRLFFNNIQFENDPWEQNRPDEVTRLNDCINKADRMGENLKKKIQEDERYERPFAGDYHIELAKDILMCSDPRPEIIPMPLERGPFDLHHHFVENKNFQKATEVTLGRY